MRAFRSAFVVAQRQSPFFAKPTGANFGEEDDRMQDCYAQEVANLAASHGAELRGQMTSRYIQTFILLRQEIEKERDEMFEHVKSMQWNVSELGDRLKRIEENAADLARERQFSTLTMAEEHITELERAAQHREQEIEQLQRELSKCAEEDLIIDDLRHENLTLRDKIERMQQPGGAPALDASDHTAALGKHEQQVFADLEKRFTDMSTAYEYMEAANGKKITELEQQLKEKNEQIAELQQQVLDHRRRHPEGADTASEQLYARIAQVTEQNDALKQKLKELEAAVAEHKFGFLYYQKFKQECTDPGVAARVEFMERELRKHQVEAEIKDGEIQRLSAADSTIVPAVDKAAECQLRCEQLSARLAQLEGVDARNQELCAENARLHAELSGATLSVDLQRMAAENVKRELRAEQIEQENQRLANELRQ